MTKPIKPEHKEHIKWRWIEGRRYKTLRVGSSIITLSRGYLPGELARS